MARKINRLSAKSIAAAKTRGYYADGGGLYLQVSEWGTQSWIFRYMRAGKSRDMGLGPLHTVGLAMARDKATQCRQLLLDGIDPKDARDARRQQQTLEAAKSVDFKTCAEAFISANLAAWKNEKHGEQWGNTLASYAYPAFGTLPVQSVDTGLVLKVLEPIWTAKAETASRLRGRIERVLDWAKVRGYRDGENPARWKGHLDKILPKLEKRKRVKHHAALPFDHIADFMAALRLEQGIAARALELTILTAVRTNEAIEAQWPEIDLDVAVWTIPAARMKAHVEHRVPLCARAVEILRALPRLDDDAYVFPGMRKGRALSNMAMLALMQRRMKRPDLTVHGFRSTFRDWAAERTNFPREVCEMALAHTIGNATEAAYRRGDVFEKRRKLMDAWAMFCVTRNAPATVVPLQVKAASPLPAKRVPYAYVSGGLRATDC